MSANEDLKRQIEQLQREKEWAEAEAEQAEALARNTTLKEYLQACHKLVLSKIILNNNIDGYLTSKVSSINPTGKHCPAVLTPQGGSFFDMQEAVL